MSRLRWLSVVTRLPELLILLIPLAAPNSYSRVWWTPTIENGANVWLGFTSIQTHYVGFVLLAFVAAALIGLLISRSERTRFLQSARAILKSHGGIWWLLLLLWSAVTVVWAFIPRLSIFNSVQLALEIFLAFWIAAYMQRRGSRLLLLSFAIPAVIFSLMAIAQGLLGKPLGLDWLGEIQRDPQDPFGFGEQEFRGYGLSRHPNNLAGFLVIGLFAQILLIAELSKRRWFFLVLMMVIVTGLGVLATVSRTAVGGLVLALPPTLIVLFLKGLLPLPDKRLIAGAALILLVSLTGFALVNQDFRDTLINRNELLLRGPDAASARLTYAFPDTTRIIRQEPILGVGNANLMVKISELRSGSIGLLLPAHNSFWVMWAELGIPGLVIFLFAMMFILARLNPANGAGVFTWGMGFVAMLVIMAFDFYPWGDLTARVLHFWMLGIWWGYCLQRDENLVLGSDARTGQQPA